MLLPPLVRSAEKSPPLPLEVGPLKSSYRGLGERCKLPHRGLGQSPSEKSNLVHFSLGDMQVWSNLQGAKQLPGYQWNYQA